MPLIASGASLRLSLRARFWLFLLSFIAQWLVFVAPASGASSPTTTTSLSLTSGGSAVTTVVSGSVVTLTATVMAKGTAVTVGQVNFCDATATYCTGMHLLGTAQLTKQGSAGLKFRPGPTGSHSYKAIFAGTANFASSTSGIEPLMVAPRIAIEQGGSPGNYTLTAALAWSGVTAPTGAVSFLDTSDNNAVLGTAALGSNATLISFGTSTVLKAPTENSYSLITEADLNGDGIEDLILSLPIGTSPTTYNLMTFLGNGDGTFTSGTPVPVSGPNVAVGDFTGDGILDLVSNDGSVLLGSGDGTFTAGASLPVGTGPYVVSDFNGDGILDLVSNDGHVLLGNGDGTFTAGASLPVVAGPYVTGDFSGDGVLDLVSSGGMVLLGKGDGTFTEGAILPVGSAPYLVGDLNGDGILDLVSNDGHVLLGNSNGTFTVGVTLPGIGPYAVGDFNGDGILDLSALVTTPYYDGTSYTVTMLLGKGDGTFTATAASQPSGNDPVAIASGDFNGDGVSDLVVSEGFFHGAGSDAKVSLSAVPASTAVAGSITVLPAGSGMHQVVASYAGDNNYNAITSSPTSLSAIQGTPTVSVAPSSNPVPNGASVTLTSTVAGSGLMPTGGVTFYDGTTELGAGTLNGSGVATFATTGLSIGSHAITASYTGDSNYTAGTSATLVLTVSKSIPTAILNASANPVLYGSQVAFMATLTGGGPAPTGTVTFFDGTTELGTETLSKGIAAYATSALSLGSHSITASYGGDSNYALTTSPATVVQVSQAVIAIAAPPPISPGAGTTATATLSASSTYSGTMNLTCTLTGSPKGAQSLPTCNLNPASVTLTAGGTGTTVLTVNTTGSATAALSRPFQQNRWKVAGEGAVLATMLMFGIPSRRRRRLSMLAILSVVFIVGAIGCGQGSSSSIPPTTSSNTQATTAGSYTFTVAGADAVNSKVTTSTSVNVTVQ